jgi:hypothetical protein
VKLANSAITYNRLTGEMDHWHRIPKTELYFRRQFVINDLLNCLASWKPKFHWVLFFNPRSWGEYTGLLDRRAEIDFYKFYGV